MTIEDRFADAAAGLELMPETAVSQRLAELEAQCRRRGDLARARRSVELDTVDTDWAAYELARHHEEAGHPEAAARWYRLAAANDFSDAALRLGLVLDQRAGEAPRREELALVAEAARWYVEAYGAGYLDAVDLLDAMIGRSSGEVPRARARPRPAFDLDERSLPSCGAGGLDAVVNGRELDMAIAHFQHCTPCQHEFVSRGGLLEQRGDPEHRPGPSPRHSADGRGDQARQPGQHAHRPPATLIAGYPRA